MSENEEKENYNMVTKLGDMKRKLATLEWDASHNQLNEGKRAYYDRLRKETLELEGKINSMKKSP